MLTAIKEHWPEYLMEAAELGLFMVSAAIFGTLLEYPHSPIHEAIPNPFIRRCIMGTAMGLTSIAIVFSPLGKQSGAHFNPAVSFTFYRLGKISIWDASFYSLFQFIGGTIGVFLVIPFLGAAFTNEPVKFVATLPGGSGVIAAFIVELIISMLMMLMVLTVTNIKSIAKYTGIFAGILVAAYIIIVGPLSGMSINPARSFASAFPSKIWMAFWIYMTAPPIGMLIASEVYLRAKKDPKIICAKLHHHNNKRCIFLNCGYKNETIKSNENPVIFPQYISLFPNQK